MPAIFFRCVKSQAISRQFSMRFYRAALYRYMSMNNIIVSRQYDAHYADVTIRCFIIFSFSPIVGALSPRAPFFFTRAHVKHF